MLFTDGDNKTEVGFYHPGPGLLVSLGRPLSQLLLLLESKEGYFPYFLEIIFDGIEPGLGRPLSIGGLRLLPVIPTL